MQWTKILRDTWLTYRRSLREGIRAPAVAFILPTLPPLFMTVLISESMGGIANVPGFPDVNYITWIAPGTVLFSAMMGAGFTATGLVVDARTGYLDRLRLLPVRPVAIMAGRLAFDMTRVLPAGSLVLIVSIGLGAELKDGVLGALAILGLVMALALAWNSLFYVAALRTLNPQISVALVPMALPFLFTSTTMIPKELMPGWLQVVTEVNPLSHMAESARMFMTGGFNLGELATALAFIMVIAAVSLFIAGRYFAALVTAD